MKQFLISSFSAALLLGTSFESQAEQIWVNGVTAESGWIDYDKSLSDNEDDSLCWAASASCVLDYWQSRYITSSYIPTGDEIWQRFKDVSKDQAGSALLGIQWWIGGDYAGTTNYTSDDRSAHSTSSTSVPIETDISKFGGYFWDVIPETDGGKSKHLEKFLHQSSLPASNFEGIFDNLFYAPISLQIRSNYGMSHAITLWGLEYEINSRGVLDITSMWITDSDDYTNQLREIRAFKLGNASLLFLDYSQFSDENVWLNQYRYINVAESDTWNFQLLIPEPTTATLSLIALAGLAARRRRK